MHKFAKKTQKFEKKSKFACKTGLYGQTFTCICILYILMLSGVWYVTDKNDRFHVGKQPSVTDSC